MGTTGVYCTIRIIFYYILIICCFFTPSIISFIIVAIVWVGGSELGLGTIVVKQWDEYMYRCDFSLPLLPTLCHS